MKIHNKLWYIINPNREDNLAYMTYYEENEACNKRMSTGSSWAGSGRGVAPTPVGVIIDNTPTTGFNIGSSVCRWSTENKVFRVTDPRGFTVEVPTENISTLLHLTNVHKGIIQEECVWARDGNSHILLPVNSEPYLATLKDMDVLDNILSVKDLKVWDRVKLYKDEKEYIYIGQYKAIWDANIESSKWRKYNEEEITIPQELGQYKDPKWQHYFLDPVIGEYEIREMQTPKIVSRVAGEDSSETTASGLKVCSLWAPQRVQSLVKVNRNEIKSQYRFYSPRVYFTFVCLGERRKV